MMVGRFWVWFCGYRIGGWLYINIIKKKKNKTKKKK